MAEHGEVSSLLEQLPEDLFAELHRFLREPSHLQRWRHLRWPHEMRTDRFLDAAGTLEELASHGRGGERPPPVEEQLRFLARAKLAVLAAAPTDATTTPATVPPATSVADLDRRLRLCAVQRGVAAAAGLAADAPALEAWDLVHRCVQAAPASHDPLCCVLGAFQLLAAEVRGGGDVDLRCEFGWLLPHVICIPPEMAV